MSSHRITTRSRSSLQQQKKNNSDNNDDDLLQREGDNDGQSDKSTNAAVAATSRNNGGGNRKNNNKRHGISLPPSDGGNQPRRQSARLEKLAVEHDESDEEDDESDEDDGDGDFEHGGGTTKTSRRGRRRVVTRSMAAAADDDNNSGEEEEDDEEDLPPSLDYLLQDIDTKSDTFITERSKFVKENEAKIERFKKDLARYGHGENHDLINRWIDRLVCNILRRSSVESQSIASASRKEDTASNVDGGSAKSEEKDEGDEEDEDEEDEEEEDEVSHDDERERILQRLRDAPIDEEVIHTPHYTRRMTNNCFSKLQFYAINLCYEHQMHLPQNIKDKDKWNMLWRIVLGWEGKEPKKEYTYSTNPLYIRMVQRDSSSGALSFKYPYVDYVREILHMPLCDTHTVQQSIPVLLKVQDETFNATGERKVILPRAPADIKQSGKDSRDSQIVRTFFASNCDLKHIALGIDKLKRVLSRSNSFMYDLALRFLEEKVGLVLNNQVEFGKYNSERDKYDGRVNCYLVPLFRAAGIPLLPKMRRYDIVSISNDIAAKVEAHPLRRALTKHRQQQRDVVALLNDKQQEIDLYRLDPKNNPFDYLLYKLCKLLWEKRLPTSTCLSLLDANHVGEEGRLVKRLMGGKQPKDCSFDELMLQNDVLELIQMDDHMKLDKGRLRRLASGEEDVKGTGKQAQLYRYLVWKLAQLKVSHGVDELDPRQKLTMADAPAIEVHHLTMNKSFMNKSGQVLQTGKGSFDGSLWRNILTLPEGEWQEFMVHHLAIGAITLRHNHQLVHYAIPSTRIPGLNEALDINIPWKETDTLISLNSAEDETMAEEAAADVKQHHPQFRRFLRHGTMLDQSSTPEEVETENGVENVVVNLAPSHDIASNKRVFDETSCAADEEQVGKRRGNGPNGMTVRQPLQLRVSIIQMKGEVEQQSVGMNDNAITNDLPNNSGDDTIDMEMAPQVHDFGEYYEQPQQLSTNYFNVPFALEPGTGDDHDDWFEVDGDNMIIERGRREKSLFEETDTDIILNPAEDDWSITNKDIVDAKKMEEEIAAIKVKRQKCEEFLAATAFLEDFIDKKRLD